jgi:uncharacterized membrane protein HdeD (DUF308 family)
MQPRGGFVARALADNWWLVLIRGLLALLFGLLALAWPGLTLATLLILFGVYAFVEGLAAFVVGLSRQADGRRRWGLAIEGILSVAAGVLVFAKPDLSALALLLVIASWAVIVGVFEIVTAIELRREVEHEWLYIVAGIASVLLGVLMFARPGTGALALAGLIAAWAIIWGILNIALALRLHRIVTTRYIPPTVSPMTP